MGDVEKRAHLCWWLLMLCFLAALRASVASAQSTTGSGVAPADEGQLQQWVDDLASPQFRLRQRAFEALVAAGADAVPGVVEALHSPDAEARARAIAILERLADARDRNGTRIARALLESTSHGDDIAASRRAEQALERLQGAWSEHARQQLQELGGVVARVNPNAMGGLTGWQVHLSRGWKGGNQRLDLLPDLGPVRWLSVENSSVNDAGLEYIGRLEGLRNLYLGNSQVTGSGLDELAPLVELRYLSLKQLPIGDNDLARLPKLPHLTTLGLDLTKIGDAGLKQLEKFPDLQILWLDHTKITDAGLGQLTALTDLKTLYLQGLQSPGPGLASLRELPNLKYLSLKGSKLEKDSLKHVAALSQLETLGLDHTNLNDDQLADLAGLTGLRVLWLSKTEVTDAGVQHLKDLPALATVYLHGARVTAEGANSLRAANPRLQVFR